MEDKKANSPLQWRDKLNGLSSLPGEAQLDKAAGWQQLHERLHAAPKKKQKTVYWMAAACLLGVMILTRLVSIQPAHPGNALVEGGQKKSSQVVAAPPQPLPAGQEPVVALQATEKKKVVLPDRTKKGFHPALVRATVADQPAFFQDTANEILLPAAILPLFDTVQQLATATKKKLPVVHINELNRGAEEGVQLTRNASIRASARYLQDDDLSSFSTSRNASDNLLKIKLSSSN
ncbi:MAG: hypothetical protein INR73_02310 [Williamsia sp.]|nr:hypothetical protein [Williamsia sp.]